MIDKTKIVLCTNRKHTHNNRAMVSRLEHVEYNKDKSTVSQVEDRITQLQKAQAEQKAMLASMQMINDKMGGKK